MSITTPGTRKPINYVLLFVLAILNASFALASDARSRIASQSESRNADDVEKYYVIGWVHREGEYAFKDGLKIGGAIDAAGGLRVRRGTLVISIQRRVNGTKIIREVDFNDPVRPRDIINVAYENR